MRMMRRALRLRAVFGALFALLALLVMSTGAPDVERAAAQETPALGLDLLTNLEALPQLRPFAHAHQVSSHDKAGLGYDGGHLAQDGLESYLRIENGEYVLLDEQGPGAVTRMWFTWPPWDTTIPNIHLRFYFDGESTPRIDLRLRDLFSGKVAPFLSPLAGGADVSSGGYYSYLPVPFARSLKITTGVPGCYGLCAFPGYYHIGYETYDRDIAVTSFTGREDVSGAVARLRAAGADPKTTAGNTVQAGATSVPAGGQATIFQRSGPGTISSIKLRIPQIVPAPVQYEVTDSGRVHRGASRFAVDIHPQSKGVRLTRRLDLGTPDQVASVYVDGSYAGLWVDAGSDAVDRWRDSSFEVRADLTAGKTRLQIDILDAAGGSDWTEYRYRVTSHAGGQDIETDMLDVGDAANEAAHAYRVTSLVATPLLFGSYPPLAGDPVAQQQSREVLTRTRLVARWDGEATPSVDAPLGGLFGSWAGETATASLLMGMDPDGFYYLYFPMPFASSAELTIVNDGAVAISDLSYEVSYDPQPYGGLGTSAGYFHATANSQTPTVGGQDYTALDIDGQGQVVGLVLFTRSLPNSPFGLRAAHLEGDERVHIDGSASPSLYGTGTEDFFNGGWYYREGMFSLPTHGAPLHAVPTESGVRLDETGTYRLFLGDAISFRTGISIGLEHGSPAGFESVVWNADYYSTVFWYGLGEPGLAAPDVLDVGNAASEAVHGYAADGASPASPVSYYYEGDADDVLVSDGGTTATGTVRFTASVSPENLGLVLRRRADQGIADQRAAVAVDGVAVGTWHDAGRNAAKRWLDSEFVVPPSATAGKSSVTISLTPEGGVPWSAYRYDVFSLVDPVPAVKDPDGDIDFDGLVNSVDLDDDGDGCADTVELSSNASRGGRRDPHNPWDFYDVWTRPDPTGQPNLWTQDRVITISGDILGVARRYGATRPGGALPPEEALSEALTPPTTDTGYHMDYDRGPPLGPNVWNSSAPDGAISVGTDLLQVARQYGHSCL